MLVALVVALHATLFLVIFPNTGEEVVLGGFQRLSFLHLSFNNSGRWLDGAVPYRDFLLEYPPGTLLFMTIPHLIGTGFLDYRLLFMVQNAVLDCAIVVALARIAYGAQRAARAVLAVYTLAIVALGPISAYRLDLAPVALTTLAVLALQRQRGSLAIALVMAGAATKLYPAVLLPPMLAIVWQQSGPRALARAVLIALVVGLAVSAPLLEALWVDRTSVLHDLLVQTNRHLQIESVWATLPLLAHQFGSYPLMVAGRARAFVVLGPGDSLGALGTPAVLAVSLMGYSGWYRAGRHHPTAPDILLLGTATLCLALSILTKVLSPQYLLWAAPGLSLLACVRSRIGIGALVLFLVALPLTQWIYPLHYGELVRLVTPTAVLVLATRNVVLMLALVALIVAIWLTPLSVA